MGLLPDRDILGLVDEFAKIFEQHGGSVEKDLQGKFQYGKPGVISLAHASINSLNTTLETSFAPLKTLGELKQVAQVVVNSIPKPDDLPSALSSFSSEIKKLADLVNEISQKGPIKVVAENATVPMSQVLNYSFPLELPGLPSLNIGKGPNVIESEFLSKTKPALSYIKGFDPSLALSMANPLTFLKGFVEIIKIPIMLPIEILKSVFALVKDLITASPDVALKIIDTVGSISKGPLEFISALASPLLEALLVGFVSAFGGSLSGLTPKSLVQNLIQSKTFSITSLSIPPVPGLSLVATFIQFFSFSLIPAIISFIGF